MVREGNRLRKVKLNVEGGPKSSVFMVTINSNQTAESLQRKKISVDEFVDDFETKVQELLQEKELYKPVGDENLFLSDIYKLTVESIQTEIAPKTKTYHIHARVQLVYKGDSTGYFHMKLQDARKELNSRLAMPNVYLNVQFAKKTTNDIIDNYIKKGVHFIPKISAKNVAIPESNNGGEDAENAIQVQNQGTPSQKKKVGRPKGSKNKAPYKPPQKQRGSGGGD